MKAVVCVTEEFRVLSPEEARTYFGGSPDTSYFLRVVSRVPSGQPAVVEVEVLRRRLGNEKLTAAYVKRKLKKAAQQLGRRIILPDLAPSERESRVVFECYDPLGLDGED